MKRNPKPADMLNKTCEIIWPSDDPSMRIIGRVIKITDADGLVHAHVQSEGKSHPVLLSAMGGLVKRAIVKIVPSETPDCFQVRVMKRGNVGMWPKDPIPK